jgi:hypothetical protein
MAMTTGRELVPAQTTAVNNLRSPSRGELVRLLRGLRALYEDETPTTSDAMRAYGSSHALTGKHISHRLDLWL